MTADNLTEAYLALRTQMQERDRGRLELLDRWGSFEKYCWDQFNPKTCIDILRHLEEVVRGHKQIVLAALCAWMSTPLEKPSLHVKNAVAFEVGRVYTQLEQEILRSAHGDYLMMIMALHFGSAAPLFISQIYHPIGGLKSLLGSEPVEDHAANRKKQAAGMRDIARLVAVFHYLVSRIHEGDYLLPPAKLRVGQIVGQLKFGCPRWPHDQKDWPSLAKDERTIGRYDNRLKPATALIYAASRVRYLPNTTLLSAIIEGNVRYETLAAELPAWLGMAAYTQQHILSQASTRPYRQFDKFFNGIEATAFPHALHDVDDQVLINVKFTPKRQKSRVK